MNTLAARTLARFAPKQQNRSIVDQLTNMKGETQAKQKLFQDPSKAHLHGADNPTWLKEGSKDNAVGMLAIGLCSLCSIQYLGGLFNMSYGTGKLE